MLATLKCLTIPAMVPVLAGPVQAGGVKTFHNEGDVDVAVVMKAGGQTVTMEMEPGRIYGAEYHADRVDSITIDSKFVHRVLTDADGINTNNWFTIKGRKVRMTPERPKDKIIGSKRK